VAIDKEEPEDEETHIDRKKKYVAFVAGGMSDKLAMEKVWPTTTEGMERNAKERAEKKAASQKSREYAASNSPFHSRKNRQFQNPCGLQEIRKVTGSQM